MKTAVIIGAGPAGLTAALELLRRSDVRPIVLEATERIGGISCTIRYEGNRMDIGGHRFFSKADRVMEWWTELMPIASTENGSGFHTIRYQNQERPIITGADAASDPDLVMLVRPRKSRIYFLRSFFDYPLALNAQTLRQLGFWRTLKIGVGYLRARLFPRRNEKTLEDFLINRFGKRALPDLLQVLHRKSVGRTLRRNQRRMGRAAHQGPFAHAPRSRTSSKRHSAKKQPAISPRRAPTPR